MILYLETNFLMGTARGQHADAEALLNASRPGLRLALPAVCVMEAWSVVEREKSQRNVFGKQLDDQLQQPLRDLTSSHAKALVQHLQQARAENFELINDVRSRLQDIQEKLAGHQAGFPAVELLSLENATLAKDLTAGPTKDPTDNLILAIILEHARQNPDEAKAFLSGNKSDFDTPEVRPLLSDVGITYFARMEAFLGWLWARP